MKRNLTHDIHHHNSHPFAARADSVFSDDEAALIQRMAEIGMSKETAIWLLEVYGVQSVKRQLDGLPYYLRAAIEDDWEVPQGIQTFPFETKRGAA